MDWGSRHCTGDRNQDHPQEKEMQKSKMAVWGGLTNICEKKGSCHPLDCKSYNHSILKEISPEYSLEGLMLKLWATWYKEQTHWKRLWCWKRLKAGGEGDDRGWDGWMASLTRCTRVWMSCRSWQRIGKPGVMQSMGSQKIRHDWLTELNWGIWVDKREFVFNWQWAAPELNTASRLLEEFFFSIHDS